MIAPQLPVEGATDPIPLVVDVDGTLICSDLLYESALQLVATKPWDMWKLGTWLAGGKASLKQNLVETTDPHIATIPLRDETVAYIGVAKAQGRPVWLASASDKRWVEQIAARVDGIDGVMGSDGVTNLAGPNKAKALVERFGYKGFDYIGDNHVDMPVWEAARRVVLVAHSSEMERAVKRRFTGVAILIRSAMGERDDVIWHRGLCDDALGSTVAAERFGLEAAQSLGNCASASQPFSHS